MTLFAGIMIVVIVFFVILYVLRAAGKYAVLAKKRRKSQDFFLCQMSDFTVNSLIVFDQADDLFSPGKMRNAGIEVIGEEIQLVDYTKDVPWFFHL